MVAFSDDRLLQYPTIRHSSCGYLLPPDSAAKCQECKKYTSTLRAQLSCHNSHHAALVVRTDASSHVSYQCLTKEEIERMRKLHEKLRTTQKERDRLKVVESEGVDVDSTTNDDLHTIAQSEAFQVVGEFAPGSFTRIFWKQQVEAASHKNGRGVRWHPLMIRWCLRGPSYFWLHDATLPAHSQGLYPLHERRI